MPITMYDKKTEQNVKVYGFVQTDFGLYGGNGYTYAVTYQLNAAKQLEKLIVDVEDLELKLVPASDLRPLDA